MKALQIENLSKAYLKKEEPAVSGITLHAEVGEIVALLGESGSGKTTLLRLIAGLDYPDQGAITIGSQVVANAGTFVKPEKRKVGLVFQNLALFPHFNVFDNVSFGLKGFSKQEKVKKVDEVLTLVSLPGMEKRYPHQLSGGQQQRVALARALAPQPEILLLDEPFSNLDNVLKSHVREEVKRILKQAGVTTIFVTHDTTDALLAADRIALMHHGKILQTGKPADIYKNPVNEKVGKFFGRINLLHLKKTERGWFSEIGQHITWPQNQPGDDHKIIFRPENVHLSDHQEGCFRGKLISSHFMGDHALLTVGIGESATPPYLLCIKAIVNHGYAIDDTVFFRIDFGEAKVMPADHQ